MKRFVLAHGLGTTGNKASLYDHEGSMLGSVFGPYHTTFDSGGRAEQDPESWWRAVTETGRRLLGERSPRWNPNARGAFVGLSARHDRGDMLRAVLEGVTMNLRLILQALTRQGLAVAGVRVIGGGARGDLWNQMMADMFEVPVVRLTELEAATSLGAAVVGGVAVGLYRDFDIVEQMNPPLRTVHPDPATAEIYREFYPLFDGAYRALEPLYDRLAGLP